MKKGRWIVLVCTVIFAAQCSFGTAVIVLRSKGEIWIAADSMETDQTGTNSRSACKILNTGQFYWAAAGPVYSDTTTGFEVSTFVDGIKSEKGTLRSKMNAFITKSKDPFARELASIEKDDPIGFAKLIAYTCLWQVVFVGSEGGHPAFVWACVTAREVNGQIILDGTPEEPPGGQPAEGDFLGIGETEEARAYLAKHRSEIVTDPAGVLRASIIVEESAKPQLVGGEVNILEISGNGRNWIAKGKCK